ncbi:MAG: winged helix-turn-helix transcriptional regulator [Opitutaceae bacterium]
MSIHYGQSCPVSKAAEVLGERWTILIIRELLLGTSRFSDFQRALSQISPTLLTKRLNQLQDWGLVVRKAGSGGQRPEYYLTAAGIELKPIVLGLGEWGMKWARGQMGDDELDVEMLMFDFCRRIDGAKLPGGPRVIEFIFPGLPKYSRWWILVDAEGKRELCLHAPGQPMDLQIRCDLRTIAEIWAGDTDIRAATKDGRLRVTGDAEMVRTLAAWLRPGAMAHIRPHPEALRV